MADNETPVNEEKRKGSIIGRLFIVGFMGAILISECLFAYFWLPSKEEVAAEVQRITEQAQQGAEGNGETKEDEEIVTAEVDLGKFVVTNHKLANEGTFRTEFHLYGTVAQEDLPEFEKLFERNEARFRDGIIEGIRASKIKELEAAGLDLIKRRFLGTSNELLGKPLLHSVVFADYMFVEL